MLLAISPDKPDTTVNKKDVDTLPYHVLSDTNNAFAKKLNLTFELEEELVNLYQSFKIDLEKAQGNSENTLPIPATYVVDKDKNIIAAWVDVDYKKRAEPEEVLNEYFKLI